MSLLQPTLGTAYVYIYICIYIAHLVGVPLPLPRKAGGGGGQKSQLWGRGCNEIELCEEKKKSACSLNDGKAFSGRRLLLRKPNRNGNSVKRSVNRRTLKIEVFWAHPLPQTQLLQFAMCDLVHLVPGAPGRADRRSYTKDCVESGLAHVVHLYA